MAQVKKGLGRGLAALIPTDDMDFLAGVARGDFSVLAPEPLLPQNPAKSNGTPTGARHKPKQPPLAVSRETSSSTTSPTLAAPRRDSSTNEDARTDENTGGVQPQAQVLETQPAASPSPSASAKVARRIQANSSHGAVTNRSQDESPVEIGGQAEGGAEGIVLVQADMVRWMEPGRIEANPYQPRRSFDEEELRNLSESIREHGVLQPIIVRPFPSTGDASPAKGDASPAKGDASPAKGDASTSSAPEEEKFQLIAGERRWRACKLAGLKTVPVVVREVSDQQALELAIIENVQRHDISSLDAALAYRRLAHEFGLSQERIAQRVGKSRPSVANTLRLLELPAEAQQALQDGALSEGHGRAILLAPGEGSRRATLRAILRGKLSVRDAEEMARRIARQAQQDQTRTQDASSSPPEPARALPPEAPSNEAPHKTPEGQADDDNGHRHEDTVLEEQLQRALSCRVQVRRRRQGGQIVLFATDQDQLERLASALQKRS